MMGSSSLRWSVVVVFLVELGCLLSKAFKQPSRSTHLRLMHNFSNSTAYFLENDYYITTNNMKDVQLGCKELRSKKYISDGYCTSIKPVTEVVCAGICLPVAELPWYTELVSRRSRTRSSEWRCVNDLVRHKRVHLICRSGDRRTYKIRVVRSCKCKKFQNHSKTLKNDI
ncbi:sclerostin domain-containing protein 1-like [Centruroides sculpturatus]|uniref:sclerostin domain-containing protein 1-like n=1 Tax=Centruroides sculpturatus TaxID=218467 RepID=UPI000C6D00F4|nr:sclerostin domain-containing protein 1-like [Centruroides sculpturatus]